MNEIIDGETGEVIDINEALNSPEARLGIIMHRQNEQAKKELAEQDNLSPDEEERLAELEADIAKNLKGFMAVGMALMEIRDKRLYRSEYERFEDYCKVVWDMSDRHARRKISATEAVSNIKESFLKTGPMGPIGEEQLENIPLPSNERQARELLQLETPEAQAAAWQETVKQAQESGSKITASLVKRTVKNHKTKAFNDGIKEAKANIDKATEQSSLDKKRTNETTRESESFKKAFHTFVDAISVERIKNWRDTDRNTVLSALLGIVDIVNDKPNADQRPYGCAMHLSDREKLKAAGFSIYRMNVKYRLIERWYREDQWETIHEFDTPAALKKAFEELMEDSKALKG